MVKRILSKALHTASMVYADYTQGQLYQRNMALKQAVLFGETLLWIFVLLFYAGAITGLMTPDASAVETNDSPIVRQLWLVMYVLILGLAAFHLPKILRIIAFNPLLILCTLWCGITVIWSLEPSITLRRAVALTMGTFAGFAFAARYDWNEMVQRVAVMALILCLITFACTISNPGRYIMQDIHVGAWRGPWVEKNQLGGMMTKSLAAALCAFAMRPSRWWLWVPTAGMAFFLVLMSTSKTSLLMSVLCIILFFVVRIFRRFPFLRVLLIYGILAGTAIVVSVLVIDPAWALGLIGKDPTLTGRTDIWRLLTEAIQKKFWLGYGYGVFWHDPNGPSYHVRTMLEWPVPTAHNGWFDSWLSGGVIIIGLFSIVLLPTVLMAVGRLKTGGVEVYWLILYLFVFVAASMSESTILQQNDLAWFLFVATTAKLWAGEKPYWRPGSRAYVARVHITR